MKGTGCARGAPASVEHGGNTAAGRFENFAAGANNPHAGSESAACYRALRFVQKNAYCIGTKFSCAG